MERKPCYRIWARFPTTLRSLLAVGPLLLSATIAISEDLDSPAPIYPESLESVGNGISYGITDSPSEETSPTATLVASESNRPVVADPVAEELEFQRAIATSLRGNTRSAIRALEQSAASDTAAIYARAMWLMQNDEIREGLGLLESISTRGDAPAETQKLIAVGYLHLDQFDRSLTAADRYLTAHGDDEYVHYVRGLALLNRDNHDEARVALYQAGFDPSAVKKIEQVVMQVPVDVAQRRLQIDDSLTTVQRVSNERMLEDGKNYNFTLLLAGEYDSNVPLQPEFIGLGSDFKKEDYRFLIASFLDVQLLTCQEFNWGFIASTYNTYQTEVEEFNIQDYMGGSYLNALLHKDLIGSFRYEFHHTIVDKTRFATEHRVTPSVTWLGSRGHTTVFYEFDALDADAPALIPSQIQTADVHRIGGTQAIYTFGGDGRIYGGYQYASTLAKGSDFDLDSHMVTGRIEVPLKCQWISDLDVRYIWDDYDNPNSLDFFERARDDDRLEVRAGLQRNFNSPVSLRFDYTYINNDSNTENLFGVRFYDYSRHVFSTQLIFSL